MKKVEEESDFLFQSINFIFFLSIFFYLFFLSVVGSLQKNAEKLVQLQNRLTQYVILKADRQLICEGELQKVCRKELQPRYFALVRTYFFFIYSYSNPNFE